MIVLACVPPVLQDGEEYHCEWSLTLNHSFPPQKGISQCLYVPSQQRDEVDFHSSKHDALHAALIITQSTQFCLTFQPLYSCCGATGAT